jgi:hypothetical protein
MKTKWKIIVLAVMVLGIGFFIARRHHARPQMVSAPVKQQASTVTQTAVSVESTPGTDFSHPEPQPTPQPKTVAKARVQKSAPAHNNVKPGKEPLQDPDARDALALVGADPGAEQYWLDAIFDSSLPDNERGDLMEDLNETGFADPKNLTSDDVPLIVSRLQIIDAVLPSADDFMTDHLLEAQKDLVNMLAKVTQ